MKTKRGRLLGVSLLLLLIILIVAILLIFTNKPAIETPVIVEEAIEETVPIDKTEEEPVVEETITEPEEPKKDFSLN